MTKLKKSLCILFSAVIAMTCVAGCGNNEAATVKDNETEETVIDSEDESKLEDALASQLSFNNRKDADKEETVYIMSDASGNVENVIVSNWLKNTEASDGLNDYTTLDNIENVKGYEQYVKNEDGSITWQTDGSDIYYQGTSTKELPVDVKVSYKLDGKEISPENLAGASGRVTIRFDYTNNTKTQMTVGMSDKDVITPFVMLSGVMLPADKFSNVEISSGKVISEGSNLIAAGYAVPGLKECLLNGIDDNNIVDAISKIDVPEYVEISADVKDFSLAMTMTIGMTDLLSSDDMNVETDISDITNNVDTLKSSADQLVSGSDTLANSLETLKNGTYSIKTGSDELLSGANSLETYTGKLADGASKLSAAVTTYTDGVDSIKNGSYALKKGSSSLSKGANSVKKGVDDVYSGEQSLKTGIDAIILGYSGDDKTEGAVKGASNLKDGTKTLSDGAKSVSDGAKNVSDGVSTLVASIAGIPSAISQTASDIIGQTGLGSLDGIAAAMEQLELAATNGGLTEEQMATYRQLSQAYYSASAIYQVSESLTSQLDGMSADMTSLEVGAKSVADGAKDVYDGSTQVASGASTLSDGISQLYSGTKSVSDGLNTLIKGTKTLKDGAKDVADGAVTISDKMKDLYDGSVTLVKGGDDLESAASTLDDSADSIHEGAETLKDGMKSLNNGAKTLDDGADELKTGAETLSDGMSKFNEEGIKKITEMFSGDYQSDLDFIEALFGTEAVYKNYSGAIQNAATNVKFIYETGAIE